MLTRKENSGDAMPSGEGFYACDIGATYVWSQLRICVVLPLTRHMLVQHRLLESLRADDVVLPLQRHRVAVGRPRRSPNQLAMTAHAHAFTAYPM